jgi:dihydrodipicolinate reductase
LSVLHAADVGVTVLLSANTSMLGILLLMTFLFQVATVLVAR